jgi:CRISPR-associated protein Csb2
VLAIEVELLCGRFVATRHDDRERGEWPPHPARLIYALVATAGPDRTHDEGAAIEWLCEQPPPAISFGDAWPRDAVTTYVPVNDRAVPDATTAVGVLPRRRQPRTFPAVVPTESTVTYVWPSSEPTDRIRSTLAALSLRLVYFGHSSSLVRATVVENAPLPTLVAGEGDRLLRVPAQGLLQALDDVLERYEATGVRGALPSDYATYGVPSQARAEQPHSVFDEVVVLRRVGGPRLPLAAVEQVATRLRAAMLELVPDPVPASISGHGTDGSPLDRPHVAFVALPDVGHPRATGSLLGMAAVLPRDVEDESRTALLAALGSISELHISRSVRWTVEPAQFRSDRPFPRALDIATWTRPASRVATATPIELDRYVNDRLGADAASIVATSAEHVGLPRPARVSLTPVSAHAGGGHIHDIRRVRARPRRPLVHAIIDFDEPVVGPVLLGSGRYRGLGLCRPLERT